MVGGQSYRSRSQCSQEDATGPLHFCLSSETLAMLLSLEGVAPRPGAVLSLGGAVCGLMNLGESTQLK